jgi:hypothetical protein
VKKSASTGVVKNLVKSVKKHPLRTAGIAAGAVVGVALLRKAVNTAAKVVTIKAVAGGASDVATAVRGGGSRAGKARKAKKPAKA